MFAQTASLAFDVSLFWDIKCQLLAGMHLKHHFFSLPEDGCETCQLEEWKIGLLSTFSLKFCKMKVQKNSLAPPFLNVISSAISRAQLNGLWFIHNEVLNFYGWILCYHDPFHEI